MELLLSRPLKNQKENIAIVPPTDKIVHTDRVQTYERDLALTRPRQLLAN